MTFDLEEVARAMRAAGQVRPVRVSGWSVDTRTQNPGDVYFALAGPNHDGHNYVDQAFAQAAAGAVVEQGGRADGRECWFRTPCGRCRIWVRGRVRLGVEP